MRQNQILRYGISKNINPIKQLRFFQNGLDRALSRVRGQLLSRPMGSVCRLKIRQAGSISGFGEVLSPRRSVAVNQHVRMVSVEKEIA